MARTTKPEKTIDEILNANAWTLTTRELRKGIRAMTPSANEAIAGYRATGAQVKSGEQLINELKAMGGKGRKGVEVGMNLTYKHKDELLLQFTRLQRFEKKETFTPRGKARKAVEDSAAYDKAYETFKYRYGNISKTEYNDFIAIINALKDMIPNIYDYVGRSLANLYANQDEKGKKTFLETAVEAYNDLKGSGASTEDYIDTIDAYLKADSQ